MTAPTVTSVVYRRLREEDHNLDQLHPCLRHVAMTGGEFIKALITRNVGIEIEVVVSGCGHQWFYTCIFPHPAVHVETPPFDLSQLWRTDESKRYLGEVIEKVISAYMCAQHGKRVYS